jgi:hypothetical protein
VHPKKTNDKQACHRIFLFSFCAPREDKDELVLIVIIFGFVFMHLEKMTMS